MTGHALEQRLLELKTLAKSMTGEEIAREVLGVLSTRYGVGSYQLCAAIRDKGLCQQCGCKSH